MTADVRLVRPVWPRPIVYRRTTIYDPSATSGVRVQELCESRGGRPGLSVLMNLTVSVDVKQH